MFCPQGKGGLTKSSDIRYNINHISIEEVIKEFRDARAFLKR